MTKWFLLFALLAVPARADDLVELRDLHAQLSAIQGVAVRIGGVDQLAVNKAVLAAILKLNQRLERLEQKVK